MISVCHKVTSGLNAHISPTRIESDYGGDLNEDYGKYYMEGQRLPETEVRQQKQKL